MTALDLIMDGTQVTSGSFDHARILQARMVSIMGMPNGTKGGQPTVIIRVPQPGGKDVFLETTLRLFVTAAKSLEAYYKEHHGYVP